VDARFLAGRPHLPGDFGAAAGGVVVNRTFVSEVLGGGNPIGQRLRFSHRTGAGSERWLEVVGVVEDLKMDQYGPGRHSAVYLPLTPGSTSSVHVFAHVEPTAEALIERLGTIVGGVHPDPGLLDGSSVEEV
jgi:hypothetical protein